MKFLKKYWYLLLVTIITVGIGVVAYITSMKLENRGSVAPTVPQEEPQATNANCKLVFSIAGAPTNTPSPTPTAGPSSTPTPTGGPSSTPTPTGGPSSTPTPTGEAESTPTPTPTDQPGNTNPECIDLTVEPTSGTPPYTVTLTCTGKDPDGDITAIEFTLPDGTTKFIEQNVGSPGSLTTTYTITGNGSNSFSCRVRDNNNIWASSDACRISVGIGPTSTPKPPGQPGPTATPTPIPTPRVPVAGVPSILGASVVAGGLLLLLLGLAF